MKTRDRLLEKQHKLSTELDAAMQDSRFKNLNFVAGGCLSKGGRNYRIRHRDKICRLNDELKRCQRAIKMVNGERFTKSDVDACRLEIMHYYDEYRNSLHPCTSVIEFAKVIRLSFWNSHKSVLKSHPVILDFENNNGIYLCYSDGKIKHRWPVEV